MAGLRLSSLYSAYEDRSRKGWHCLHVLTLWLPTALFTVYVKFCMLQFSGFHGAALYVGRLPLTSSNGYIRNFDFLEILSFFRWDLILAFGALPLALWLLSWVVPSRYHSVLVAAGTAVCLVAVDVELQSFYTTGKFIGPGLLVEGVRWGVSNRDQASSYLSRKCVLALLLPLFSMVSLWLSRYRQIVSLHDRFLIKPLLGVYAGCGLLGFAGLSVPLKSTHYHQPVFGWVLDAVWTPESDLDAEFSHFSFQQIPVRHQIYPLGRGEKL
jgi:hypothetical protein